MKTWGPGAECGQRRSEERHRSKRGRQGCDDKRSVFCLLGTLTGWVMSRGMAIDRSARKPVVGQDLLEMETRGEMLETESEMLETGGELR